MPNFDQGGRSKKKKKNPIKLVNNLIKMHMYKTGKTEGILGHA